MSLLTPDEAAIAAGTDGRAMAMRIVAESARLLGAPRLIPVASAHIDGALYHGCLLYTSPSPRDLSTSRMPSSA